MPFACNQPVAGACDQILACLLGNRPGMSFCLVMAPPSGCPITVHRGHQLLFKACCMVSGS